MTKRIYILLFVLPLSIIFIVTGMFLDGQVGNTSGSYHISQNINGQWVEKYVESFGLNYETKTFSFSPENGSIHIKINQQDVSYGDIDLISLSACGQTLTPLYGKFIDTQACVLEDTSFDDHNVIVSHEQPVEFMWDIPHDCSQAELTIKANEYESPVENAFRFPSWGIDYQEYVFENNGSLVVDGDISEVDGQESTYAPFWYYATGHPSNYTYLYLRDDAENVYIAADVTGDNSNEFGADFLKIIAINSVTGQDKEYLVDDYTDTYGTCGFGITSKVSYKHAMCELAIPKSELSGNSLQFYLRYYGTGGENGISSYQTTLDDYSDTTPQLSGSVTAYGADNITGVSFGIYDLARDEYTIPAESGTCTADDGSFDSDSEDFTCVSTEELLYNTNYQFELVIDTQVPFANPSEANKEVKFTLYQQEFNILYSFSNDESSGQPSGSLIEYDSKLYGLEYNAIFSISTDGSSYSKLHTFQGGVSDGSDAQGSLVEVSGTFYGITRYGGTNNLGTIFSINADGSDFTLLHSFEGEDHASEPIYSMVFYNNKLYGTTIFGGANNLGMMFSIDLDGSNYEQHYSFSTVQSYQFIEYNGTFYGTQYSPAGTYGHGVLYSINQDGSNFTVLHNFNNINGQGYRPMGGIVASNGIIYGTTRYTGVSGQGTIYAYDIDQEEITFLHNFQAGNNDGGLPVEGLAVFGDRLYGVTYEGGDHSVGTIFAIDKDGTNYTLHHEFWNNESIWAQVPYVSGNIIYGMTTYGGDNRSGYIYSLDPNFNRDVVINKISPRTTLEWIELFNTTSASIDLDGWKLIFTNPSADTITLTSSDVIPKNGLLTIDLDPDTLSDTTGTISLVTPNNNPICSLTYGATLIPAPMGSQLVYRKQDGQSVWDVSDSLTKGWFSSIAPPVSTINSEISTVGVTSNIDEIEDLTRAQGLFFEKSGIGRIEFSSTLNLTDSDVVSWLQNLSDKLDISTGLIGLDADTVNDLILTQATLTMYNIDVIEPLIYVDGVLDTGSVVSNIVYDSQSQTLTFDAAHFTTFEVRDGVTPTSTPTPTSVSSPASSSTTVSSSNVACNNSKPLFISDLFEIRATKTSAKLFFTPLADTSEFYIIFSEKSNAEEHGEQVTLIREGVQSHTIYQLKSNTVYYAKVRGQSGCAVGGWSNILKFKTNNKVYYKSKPFIISSLVPRSLLSKPVTIQADQESVQPTSVPTHTPKPNTSISKSVPPSPTPSQKCFLWWCW